MTRAPFLTLLTLLTTVSALTAEDTLTFERDVRPILKAHCFQCHGEAGEREGGLDLRLRRFMATGGETGPAIVPGKPQDSLLVQRIRSGEMPPVEDASKHVPPEQLAVLVRWISGGAVTARDEPETITDADFITPEDRAWWSFLPVVRPSVPKPSVQDEVTSPIDAFLLRRLEQDGLSFATPADRVTLIRRAYFSLLGVPPEPDEVQQFVEDESPGAWTRLIDRLLASPWYGDRWGRHWLDVAGYSDSEGYTNTDVERPWAWKYRDWVIRSLNADKPFDEFVREQLAGDEMITPPYAELPAEGIDRLIATGFLRMSPDGTGGGADDVEVAKNDVMAETIKIVSTSLLGMTVGCAQCHDHRYDPIPQSDYYRMRAIFEPAYNWKSWRVPNARRVSLYSAADKQRAADIEAEAKKIDAARIEKQNQFIARTFDTQLAKLPAEMQDEARAAFETPDKERTPEQKALLKKHPTLNVTAGSLYLYDRKASDELKAMTAEATKLRGTKPKEEFVRALTEVTGQVPETFLFHRGDHEQPKQKLEPASLTVLHSDAESARLPLNDEALPSTGRRLAWANRLTDGSHPLLARVIVNRVWLHHFGRGLVNTPGDFGVLGDRPTHPELLDWLAAEFVESGWSLKQLHRLIMTSSVYQQAGASHANESAAAIDPDNKLYWQFPLRRLDAETMRDSILRVAGKLNDRPFGPAVPVMADNVGQFVIGKENLNAGRPGAVIDMKGEEFRRTIFVQSRRSRPLTVLDTFDLPRMDPNCEKRTSSTVATQSLLLINSDFMVRMSEQFAARVRAETVDRDHQIRHAWKSAFARAVSEEEHEESREYLDAQTEHFAQHPVPSAAKGNAPREASEVAFASFCQLLLSSNEFLYVD